MRFFLEDLLHLQMFSRANIVAGAQYLGNRIGGISIVDQLPETLGIKKGGMVYLAVVPEELTEPELERFFSILREQEVGAICYKAHYENREPKGFIAKAEATGLPVIVLPNTFDFSEAVDIFLSHIFCKNTKEFIHQDNLHMNFNIQYSRHGIQGIMDLFHELSGLSGVSLVNMKEHSFGGLVDLSDQEITDLWQEAELLVIPKETFTYDYKLKRFYDTGREKNYFLTRTFYKDIEGYIAVKSDYEEISDSDASLMCFAAYWLTLVHKKTHNALFQSLADQREYMDNLLHGNYTSWEEAAKVAKKMEWNLPQSLRVVALDYHLEDIVGLLETIRGLFYGLMDQIPIVTEYDRRILMLLPEESGKPEETAGHIVEMLRKKYSHAKFHAGIGELVRFDMIGRSNEQALQALSIANVLDQFVVDFLDTGVLRLFASSLENQEVQDFYRDYYMPLKVFDEKHDAELRRTLRYYLDSGCNYSETAKKLYLHYNTVRYRIGMIEKLCNVNMKSQDGLVNMGVALKISELIDK